MHRTYDHGSEPAITRHDPADATPRWSQLDCTIEELAAGTNFRTELDAAFKQSGGECIEFDRVGLKYGPDELAASAVYSLVAGLQIELVEDDDLDAVRRKIAASLRAAADAVIAEPIAH